MPRKRWGMMTPGMIFMDPLYTYYMKFRLKLLNVFDAMLFDCVYSYMSYMKSLFSQTSEFLWFLIRYEVVLHFVYEVFVFSEEKWIYLGPDLLYTFLTFIIWSLCLCDLQNFFDPLLVYGACFLHVIFQTYLLVCKQMPNFCS